MNKQEYAKQLLSRLAYMIDENEKMSKVYKQIQMKIPAYDKGADAYWKAIQQLSESDYNIWSKHGLVYSNASLQRIRIELNTVLIEIEKEGK